MPAAKTDSLYFLLGTFRHPLIYTLSLDTTTGKLACVAETEAVGGHSWLHVSNSSRYLYCTVWGGEPRLAAYSIERHNGVPVPRLINESRIAHLSGYVTSNDDAVFSASGPQCDVIDIDPTTGGFASSRSKQQISLLDSVEANGDGKHSGTLAFGGLRHGGHSADLSPDGSRLYVADIGRNCVWVFRVGEDNLLTLGSKYKSRRSNDGPRHAWAHPNGRIVYSLQEHSSLIDVLEHQGDELVWRQAARLIPEDANCDAFWADEVRLDPSNRTLFGSTRGLTPEQPGYVTAFALDESGLIVGTLSGQHPEEYLPSHIYTTPTSGGWANAINPCPIKGPQGRTWLTLTDSEEGFVQVLAYSETGGFVKSDRWDLPKDAEGRVIGASVTAWLL